MSNFNHTTLGKRILGIAQNLATSCKWTITSETRKSVSALTHMQSGIVNSIYIQWLEDGSKAILSLDLNYFDADAPSDRIQIDISITEANRIAAAIEENCVLNWSKQGLEIPDVEIDEAA
jgi:hypothetical protein